MSRPQGSWEIVTHVQSTQKIITRPQTFSNRADSFWKLLEGPLWRERGAGKAGTQHSQVAHHQNESSMNCLLSLWFQAKFPLNGFHGKISSECSWKADSSEQVSRWPGPAGVGSRGARSAGRRTGDSAPTHRPQRAPKGL